MNSQFVTQLIALMGTILFLSAIVTWSVETFVKPFLSKLKLGEEAYANVVRIAAAVVGIIVAGLFGNPNLLAGVVFYGYEIPPIIGMVLTGISLSMSANAWHELGEFLNARPATNIAATDSNIAISDNSNGDTQPLNASSAARSQSYQRRE